MIILTKEIFFPPVVNTTPEGLYAVGGDLSPERLLLAYKKGIFPWFNEDEPISWYSPGQRCVLFPDDLIVSRSMKAILKAGSFSFSINKAFDEVIDNCRTVKRSYGEGTWISQQIIHAYKTLFKSGHVESAEAWDGNTLAGGLYGVKMENVFFGESMFSNQSNASKFAFIKYVQHLKFNGIQLIDCQVYTKHLASLGARLIPRSDFLDLLEKYILK